MSEHDIVLEEATQEPVALEVSEAVIEAVSPKVSTEAITGGHRVTVTDIDGEKTFDVMDGEPGKPGKPGDPGQDGVSPTISVAEITGGHRVTVTDAVGGQAFDVMNGEPGKPGNPGDPGQDGVSPTITVTDITGGHRVTITDATGAHSFDVMDGTKGDPGDDYVLTAADKQEIAGMVDVTGKMDEPATEGTAGQVLTTDGQGGRSWTSVGGETITVPGTTPSITGMAGVRYVCGECATLDVIAPATGCIDVTFTSGSTPTALTVTSAKANTTIKWANGFDPSTLDADTVYEINVLDGELGVAGAWT